jgi:hypothetical protein
MFPQIILMERIVVNGLPGVDAVDGVPHVLPRGNRDGERHQKDDSGVAVKPEYQVVNSDVVNLKTAS